MFQVEWLQTALNELAAAWAGADSAQRNAITAANYAIDRRLERDPSNEGESRDPGRRILFQPPLAITYEVDLRRRVVRVLHAWTIRKGG